MENKKRVLVIEDDQAVVDLLRESLKDNYQVALARNGRTGMSKAWANSFDVILLDIELGDIDGFTICRKLKNHPSTNHIPIIIISVLHSIESTLEGFNSGASDFLRKPFHPEELKKRIELHLKMSELNNRLRQQALANRKSKTDFSMFISTLAHELRSPLNSIIGFSEILNDPNLSPKDRNNFLRYINQGGQNLLKLLNDLIDHSKIEAENLSIHFSKVDVKKELDELIHQFSDEMYKQGEMNKTIVLEADTTEANVMIYTDIVRFLQIIKNFVENAIKYSHENGLVIVSYQLLDDNRIKVSVKDHGIGMDDESLENLFKLDNLEGGYIQIKKSGKGLGMALAYKLSNLIGGQIHVESKPNLGSTFSLTLPRNFMNDEIISQIQEIQSYVWKDKTILIAEDVMVNYLFYVALLKKTNVKLIHAKDGLEVLDLLEEYTPDLILMDMVMPKMSGLEATLQVRKYFPQIPIIAQSSVAGREDKESIYRAGCNDIITKPIKPQILLDKINRFFE